MVLFLLWTVVSFRAHCLHLIVPDLSIFASFTISVFVPLPPGQGSDPILLHVILLPSWFPVCILWFFLRLHIPFSSPMNSFTTIDCIWSASNYWSTSVSAAADVALNIIVVFVPSWASSWFSDALSNILSSSFLGFSENSELFTRDYASSYVICSNSSVFKVLSSWCPRRLRLRSNSAVGPRRCPNTGQTFGDVIFVLVVPGVRFAVAALNTFKVFHLYGASRNVAVVSTKLRLCYLI